MTDNFLRFKKDPTIENFISVQNEVFNHPDYEPYSDDLYFLEDLLEEREYQKIIEYNNINLLLSPKAHFIRSYAYNRLDNDEDAFTEFFLAMKILECIKQTGDGSVEKPYLITRISDERDMLESLEEEFERQSLIIEKDMAFDLIICSSGKEICFDISKPYFRQKKLFDRL